MNKIKNRRDLVRLNEAIYRYLLKEKPGLLDKYLPVSSKLNKNQVIACAKRCSDKKEFRDKFLRHYRFAQRHNFLLDISKFLPNKKSSLVVNKKHTKENVFKVSKKYKYLKEFKDNEPGSYCEALRNKWLQNMPWLIRHIEHGKCNEKYIRSVAKECSNRTEFHRKYPGSAQKAKELGIYQNITEHMINKTRKKVIRDDGLVFESSALASRTIGKFKGSVSKAIIGGWKCGGYLWAYCDENGNILK